MHILLTVTNILMFLFQDDGAAGAAAAALISLVFFGVFAVVGIVMIASMWKIFAKAGEPGWAALVPIYNLVVMLKIIDKPIWWIVLFFIPMVNMVVSFILVFELAKKFGQGAGFAIGMIVLPFVFYPMLAFGSAQYQGGQKYSYQ